MHSGNRTSRYVRSVKNQAVGLPGVAVGDQRDNVAVVFFRCSIGTHFRRVNRLAAEYACAVIPLCALTGVIVVLDQTGETSGPAACACAAPPCHERMARRISTVGRHQSGSRHLYTDQRRDIPQQIGPVSSSLSQVRGPYCQTQPLRPNIEVKSFYTS